MDRVNDFQIYFSLVTVALIFLFFFIILLDLLLPLQPLEIIKEKYAPVSIWGKYIKKYFALLLLYFFFTVAIVTIYAYFYKRSSLWDLENAIELSLRVFFALETSTGNIPIDRIIIMETITREIMVVMLLGNFVSKMLVDVNPIVFTRFFVFDGSSYCFRYWVVLPRGKYLYDVKVRVIVVKNSEFNSGKNKMESAWQFEQSLDFIRGVRSIEIDSSMIGVEDKKSTQDEDQGKTLREVLKQTDNDSSICVIIKGINEDGRYYNQMYRYSSVDCIEGCKFVSIQRNEFAKDVASKQIITPIRYQHFNRVYVCDKRKALSSFTKNQKRVILTEEQIKKSTYKGNYLADLASKLLAFLYERL